MIINSTTEVKVLSEGQAQETIGMQLDLDSAHILMTMLSKNLYSDSIGSTIRETASNALDSHRRVGSDKPIIVSFGTNSQNNYEFSVEDFGSGLDDLDVSEIISKYGKSTKRTSNTELGCFGLGFKAPLSYSSSFIFICRKDNIERKYMMSEGEEGNTIDLLFECVTPEDNGVKIIVPVEYKDRYVFITKMKEQLAYFENVYFNVEEIDNEFSILRETDFQVSELNRDFNMHICLDNVYYPIDFNKLNIDPINVSVGLRFSLTDGLFPTPSRENLIYSENTKRIILDRIKVVSKWLVEKYNEEMEESENLKEIFNYYQNNSKNLKLCNTTYSINEILKYTDVKVVKPKMKGIEKIDLKYLYLNRDNITKEYKVTHRMYNYSINAIKNSYTNHLKEANFPVNNIYVYSQDISFLKKEYLKDISKGECFLAKKQFDFKLNRRVLGNESLMSMLDLKNHPKSDWRQIIQEFQTIQKIYTNQFINVDLIEPTKEWLEARKKQRVYIPSNKREKLTGEINCKMGKHLSRSNGNRNCKFEPMTLQLEDLHKKPLFYIYGLHDDYLKLDQIYNGDTQSWNYVTAKNKERLRLFTVSPSEYKKLEQLDIHNLISYNKFMEGDNKPFRRIVTAQVINRLMNMHNNVFSNIEFIKDISTLFYDKLKSLEMYRNENYYPINDEVRKSIIEVADDKNLYDSEIYSVFNEVSKTLNELKFLNLLMGRFKSNYSSDKEELLPVIVELCKYHKFRLNYTHYNLPMVIPQEEIIETEEIDEELSV